MNTAQAIPDAILESIETTSVVRVTTNMEPHSALAFIRSMDGVGDVDFAQENDGTFDVWGGVRGDQFRIRLACL
jgi:hypothetical protein